MRIYEIITGEELRSTIFQKIQQSGLKFYPFTMQTGQKKTVVYWSDRFFVVVDVHNVKMPFYLSSGLGGKTNVPPGKWYPYFGVGPDGWLNKTSEEQILNYYHSNKLKSVAHKLDEVLGDLRHHIVLFPAVGYRTVAPNSNQDMDPVAQDEGTAQIRINNVLKRIGDVHFKNSGSTSPQTIVKPKIDQIIADYASNKLNWNQLSNQIKQIISQHPDKEDKITNYFNNHPTIKLATKR
jgi:hypothetical protein